jgi:hypothetical protein
MDLEALQVDLLRLAKRDGPLDANKTEEATTLLALPRYTTAANGPQLLADDLHRVIDQIPGERLDVEWYERTWGNDVDEETKQLRGAHRPKIPDATYARTWFGLDFRDEPWKWRQTLGADLAGNAARHLTGAVLFRVLSGLLALGLESAAKPDLEYGLAIHRVVATYRAVDIPAAPIPAHFRPRDELVYDLELKHRGPQCLVVPRPRIRTRLDRTEAVTVNHTSRSDLVHHVDITRMPGRSSDASIAIVGVGCDPGDRLVVGLEYPTPDREQDGPISLSYEVLQPVDELVLVIATDGLFAGYYRSYGDLRFEVTLQDHNSSEALIAEPPEGRWQCLRPEVGTTYTINCKPADPAYYEAQRKVDRIPIL